MKKLLVFILTIALALSLVACGGEQAAGPDQQEKPPAAGQETKFETMTFGDVTISVPNVFNPVTETQGVFVAAGPTAAITVTPAIEVDIMASDWDESLAEEVIELLYGATYTELELSAFEGDVNMNGNTAVYMAFFGKNAEGVVRLIQVVRLYNADETEIYVITFVHSAEDAFFTSDIAEQIINSITLKP